MKQHPYLRAYMAGIVVPTVFLLFFLTFFIVARIVYQVPFPLERVIVFPMALVPNLWGVWNMLHLRLHSRRLPIGFHGALLPILLTPAGFAVARTLDFVPPLNAATPAIIGFPIVLVIYYLVWKYLVGFFNELLGIA